MSDTTETIAAATSHTAKYVAAGAAVTGSFLAGVMIATSAGGYGVGLSQVGWDLARAGAVVCGVVAAVALLICWGVRQLELRADRNCNVSRAVEYELVALRRELALVRGQAAVKPSPFDHDVKAAVADIASFMERR